MNKRKGKEIIIMTLTMTHFEEALKPFFDKLNIDPISFDYYNTINKFVSSQPFFEEDEKDEYYIVIKLINNTGTIVVGTTDGIRFYETEMLGQIVYDNDQWVSLL